MNAQRAVQESLTSVGSLVVCSGDRYLCACYDSNWSLILFRERGLARTWLKSLYENRGLKVDELISSPQVWPVSVKHSGIVNPSPNLEDIRLMYNHLFWWDTLSGEFVGAKK